MRTDAWGGLMTNASPFALPPGAAVEQVNLCADVPGQIYTRGGMRHVAFVEQAGVVLDCYPYVFEGRLFLVALQADGSLVALESPAYGQEMPSPQEPALTAGQGLVASSYTTQYAESGTATPPPPPAAGVLISTLTGGSASTQSWQYSLNANALCAGDNKEDAFSGGNASTANVPAALSPDELCPA